MENELNVSGQSGVIFQVSLLQGLASGDYFGSVATGELKKHGDTGIGTFNRLNGELIMLDGKVYRASGNGNVELVSDDETTPFAVVSFMNADLTKNLKNIPDFDSLERELNLLVEENGANRFYMIRVDGIFSNINVRSINAQNQPYRRLSEVLEDDQTIFDYENISGSLVGIYCPPYMAALNAAGWHMHFISDDRASGGHILNLGITDAHLTMSFADALDLRVPHGEMFSRLDLSAVRSDEIEKIEKNR